VFKFTIRLEKTISILLIGGLLLGILSIAVFPASAGPSGDEPAPLVPDLSNPIYIPFLTKNISDLYISNIEITQAVQNISTPVSLVAGRPSVARVYARTSGSTQVGNIYASLVAYKNGTRLGKLTSGSGSAYLQTDSLDNLRASATKSFNFTLPTNWTVTGNLTLAANIDIYNTAQELSEVNTTTLQYTFNTVPVLNVQVVPINYTNYDGVVYPHVDTSVIQNWLQEGLFRMYPVSQVNLSYHSAIDFNGDLAYTDGDWSNLLDLVDSLKMSESQPEATVYFGVIPMLANGGTWFDSGGGVVGYGYVGYRASIAVEKTTIPIGYGQTWALHGDDYAAHEIGHNLGMDHTPCNVSSPYQYPYANGAIGQYGFYVKDQVVMDKNRPDIMSYCEPEWVSDFTYQRWYDNQKSMLARVAQPVQDSVFVRVNLANDGTAKLQPVYGFAASPSDLLAKSDYSIQFLDDQGKPVNEYPVNVMRAEEHGHTIQTIHARLPRPSQPYSTVRVVYKGQIMDTRSVSSQAKLAPMAAPTAHVDASNLVLSWSSTGSLTGIPALVRYTSDGGQTWMTVGVDVTGSEIRLPVADLPAMPLQFQVIPADGTDNLTVDWTP
jgi:hypothetical protein